MPKDARNLILFFAATFAATYTAYFTILLNGWSPYQAPGLIFFLTGGSAPSWVGLLFVFFSYDKGRRRDYFKRLSPRLIAGRWWAIIFLVFPFIFAVAIAIELLLGGSLPGMDQLKQYIAQPAILPFAVLMGLGSGPISEEFGWRGYALNPLIRRFGPVAGTAALGLLWGVWHLPLFFMPQTWHGQMGFRFAGFFTFILFSLALSWLMTWVHSNTHGSILAALLMHFCSNFTASALLPYSDRFEVICMAVLLALGLGLCLSLERKTQLFAQPAFLLASRRERSG
jgi:membrane protease YdiL (CAAX protease family)